MSCLRLLRPRCTTLCNRRLKECAVLIVLLLSACVYYLINTTDVRHLKGTMRLGAQEYMMQESKHTTKMTKLVKKTVPAFEVIVARNGLKSHSAQETKAIDMGISSHEHVATHELNNTSGMSKVYHIQKKTINRLNKYLGSIDTSNADRNIAIGKRVSSRDIYIKMRQLSARKAQTSVNLKAYTFKEAKSLLTGYTYEDIMSMKPIRYLKDFKNPCWLGTKDNGPVNDNKIHCLPYFYIIGVKKCGTSDLFGRIMLHPDVTSPSFKESQWMSRRRFLMNHKQFVIKEPLRKVLSNYDSRELSYYVHMFDVATKWILSAGKEPSHNKTVSTMITGEGSPSNLHIQGAWDILPGNEGRKEPRYINAHYIRHLIPQAKIIINFRNPVDRLYSDFLHHNPKKSAESFHQEASSIIDVYNTCFEQYPFLSQHVRARRWILCVLYEGAWQILPILFDDYIGKPKETMTKLFDFLELRRMNETEMEHILKGRVRNRGAKKPGPMLAETRQMIHEFYRSSNEEMAKLMNDDRYLFAEK